MTIDAARRLRGLRGLTATAGSAWAPNRSWLTCTTPGGAGCPLAVGGGEPVVVWAAPQPVANAAARAAAAGAMSKWRECRPRAAPSPVTVLTAVRPRARIRRPGG